MCALAAGSHEFNPYEDIFAVFATADLQAFLEFLWMYHK